MRDSPIIALSQGDPAGIGPEVLLKALCARLPNFSFQPLVVGERAAFEAVASLVPEAEGRVVYSSDEARLQHLHPEQILVYEPVGSIPSAPRVVRPGRPSPEDARGAMMALDAGIELARSGRVKALVTAPLNKSEIARHVDAGFRGHTDYLAAACGGLEYGRDYLMTFLADDLRVALLSTHVPLRQAIDELSTPRVVAALACLDRNGCTLTSNRPRIGLAGLNPHAGEGGLLGAEDGEILEPAVALAREQGIRVFGPLSPDTIFQRARSGEFDWILALYHDQGLIAVKTIDFGRSTNWTLGLPFLRTSVDHGTAYEIAGQGRASSEALGHVLDTTVGLLERAASGRPGGGR